MYGIFRVFLNGVLLFMGTAFSTLTIAQTTSTQPIRLVVGFPAGGPADIAARILAEGLQEVLNQTVIVENRTGAGGNIAARAVAGAQGDGLTILIATASLTVNSVLSKNAGYDPIKDFLPVAMIATQANAVVVTSKLPISTLADLQLLVKSKKISVATSGVGTSSHITAAHLFNVNWKSDASLVPYRGAGPAGLAVASGEAEAGFTTVTALMNFHQMGKAKILAVVSDKRLPELPSVPTMIELGYKQYASSWTAMFVPSSTPPAIVQKLHDVTKQLMARQDIQQKFTRQSMIPSETPPQQQITNFLKNEVSEWGRITKETGTYASQ
jgi:tripartite-type tricarboxylate transporter receptor subunit TctC